MKFKNLNGHRQTKTALKNQDKTDEKHILLLGGFHS